MVAREPGTAPCPTLRPAGAGHAPKVLGMLPDGTATSAGPAIRQTKRFEQKRQAILDSAARLFNQKGLKGTTLSDVAQHVGLVTNSVTYYFRKKEELATACLLRSIAVIESLIATAAAE